MSMQAHAQGTTRRRERGASAVEFAVVAPAVFLLMIAIVEVCALFWVNLTMQYAAREGARYAVTGRADRDPVPAGNARHRAVIEVMREHSMGLFERVEPRINNVAYGDPNAYTEGMFGTPGEISVLTVDCSWPLMTPLLRPFFEDGRYRFRVAVTMRNEAFRS